MKKYYAVLLLVIMLFSLLAFYYMDDKTIRQGIYIENIPVGGLTKAEAEKLFACFNSDFNGALCISAGGIEKIISFSDINLCRDYQGPVEKAYAVGREKNFFLRIKSLHKNARFGTYLLAEWSWNEPAARAIVSQIAESVYYPSCSASLYVDKAGHVLISDSYCGLVCDTEYSIRHVDLKKIALGKWKLKTESIPPAISTADAQAWNINGAVASFTTRFNAKQKERSKNIQLAAAAINNTLVLPGEEFSFNETTGPRTAAMGYQEAYIIMNNKFEKGLGGGVCQVSSTLYNAVLGSGLPITERFPHSLGVSYVPKGKDATVSYGTLDLKFINTMDTPVIIHTEYKSGILKIALFGHAY